MSQTDDCDPTVSVGPLAAPGADGHEHPLSPCAMVLFGATGDLTRRKITPALFGLKLRRLLPERFALVAFARRDKDDAGLRAELKDAVRQFAPQLPVDGPDWEAFAASIFYIRSELDDAGGYARLSERLAELDRDVGLEGNRLFYLATPPENFAEIAQHLGEAGLNRPPSPDAWSRIVVEKPFGSDLGTAQELNRQLRSVFAENRILRIDHYLGKETVQNILVLRFANRIFEPLWNERHIDHVQITVAETVGVEGRGGYFERSGTTRDMVQNHLLQVLTLVAMEPPVDLSADAVRDEKVKALRCIRPFSFEDVSKFSVRGQYGPGTIREDGADVALPGYRQETGVDPHSSTETFAAFRFQVDNWRWAGVPFYVQAGKRMPRKVTEVAIHFKPIPRVLFAQLPGVEIEPNCLILRIQPDEGASIMLNSKAPGPDLTLQPVRMDFDYGKAFSTPISDAYERLIRDAIRGDASLFARGDEVEEAWRVVTPILDSWRDLSCPLFPNYAAGTWGPDAACILLTNGRTWIRPA